MTVKSKEEQIYAQLEKVMDPELNLSVVDMGLIYEVKEIKNNQVEIVMTLTTIGCPLFSVIESDIKNRVQELGYKEENIEIELVFDPPWTMDKMSESAKAMLGI
jgi:metal-sulfur cluster biosynthetic enzyme